MVITTGDLDNAVRLSSLSRPSFQSLFGNHGPGVHLAHKIFNREPYRHMTAANSFTQRVGSDPLSLALKAAGASITHQHDFRMLNGMGDTEYHLKGSQCAVHKLPGRLIRNNPNIFWAIGIRAGRQIIWNLRRARHQPWGNPPFAK